MGVAAILRSHQRAAGAFELVQLTVERLAADLSGSRELTRDLRHEARFAWAPAEDLDNLCFNVAFARVLHHPVS